MCTRGRARVNALDKLLPLGFGRVEAILGLVVFLIPIPPCPLGAGSPLTYKQETSALSSLK